MAKIALIDDDQDILDALTLVLESNGHTVVKAMDPESGFKLIETEQPDLIILDVMMNEPDDGFFMALKLRKSGLKTPIVMLSSVAKATGMEYSESETIPVEIFLDKPVKSEQLLEVINKYLKS